MLFVGRARFAMLRSFYIQAYRRDARVVVLISRGIGMYARVATSAAPGLHAARGRWNPDTKKHPPGAYCRAKFPFRNPVLRVEIYLCLRSAYID